MSRKTLALVLALVGTTAFLLLIAIRGEKKMSSPTTPSTAVVSPTVPAPVETVLAMTPNPVTLDEAGMGKVDVTIDSGMNKIQGVQLEIEYDPMVLSNVKVQAGTFLKEPVVIINNNDSVKGKISYGFGISPTQQAVTGKGVAATITFTKKSTVSADVTDTQITLLQTSQIASADTTLSVLKTASGATVLLKSR